LKSAELKVLLVIIRQTLGWADKQEATGRKDRDWIASRQLQEKTGASRRAISSATGNPGQEKIYRRVDETGNTLFSPATRQGNNAYSIVHLSSYCICGKRGDKLFVSFVSARASAKNCRGLVQKKTTPCAKNAHNKRNPTKLTLTKY